MLFLDSMLFGTPGGYNILGSRIVFQRADHKDPIMSKTFRIFCLTMLGYAHVLAHEIGHTIAARLLGEDPKYCPIFIGQHPIYSQNMAFPSWPKQSWKENVVLAAGPMTNIILSNIQIIVAIGLRNLIAKPVTFVLAAGGIGWVLLENLMAFGTAYLYEKQGNVEGDFGKIAQNSPTHIKIAKRILRAQFLIWPYIAAKVFHATAKQTPHKYQLHNTLAIGLAIACIRAYAAYTHHLQKNRPL